MTALASARLQALGWMACSAFLALASAAYAETQAECQDRWLVAESAGITHGAAFVHGTPTVVVDALTWERMDYQTKLGVVQTFNCAIAGPDQMFGEIDFVSNLTNQVVGRWRLGKGLVIP